MRITRGDNIAFLFLPALTLLGVAGTFVAGKIHSAFYPTIITVSNNTGFQISELTVSCSGSYQTRPLKVNDLIEMKFPECDGKVSFSRNNVFIGSCSFENYGFSRLDVNLIGQNLSENDCKFTE